MSCKHAALNKRCIYHLHIYLTQSAAVVTCHTSYRGCLYYMLFKIRPLKWAFNMPTLHSQLSPPFPFDLSGHLSVSGPVDILLFVMCPNFLSHWYTGSSQVKSIIQMFYLSRKVGHMSDVCTQLSHCQCCTAMFRGQFNGIHNDVLDRSQSSTLVAWQHMVLLCRLGNDESCCCFGRNTKIYTTWFLRLKVDVSSAYGFPPAW